MLSTLFFSVNFQYAFTSNNFLFFLPAQDIARDVRETKVHYSPSEKDGVFVVEVARGADSNACSINPHVPLVTQPDQPQENSDIEVVSNDFIKNDYDLTNDCGATFVNGNEEVLVHPPPNGIGSDDDVLTVDEEGAVSMSSPQFNGNANGVSMKAMCGSTNTGLSQSDLSISSSGSNQGYCYGSQQPYMIDPKGYQSNSPHPSSSEKERIIIPEPFDSVDMDRENANDEYCKPVITAAICKVEPNNLVEPQTTIDTDNNLESIVTNDTIIQKSIDIHENGIKSIPLGTVEKLPETNGKHHNGENDYNENVTGIDETNEFDSLMNLPAPPTCDEIKQLNDITTMDNGNLDSLPPPPPPEIVSGGPINVES